MKKNQNGNHSTDTMIDDAAGDLRSQIGVIGDDIRTLGRQVKQITSRQLHAVGDRATAMADAVGDRVRDQPMRAVLIAAGVGAVLGLLLRRR